MRSQGMESGMFQPERVPTESLSHFKPMPESKWPEHLVEYKNEAINLRVKMSPVTKALTEITDMCALREAVAFPSSEKNDQHMGVNEPIYKPEHKTGRRSTDMESANDDTYEEKLKEAA